MNYRLTIQTLGRILLLEAVFMLPALAVCFIYQSGDHMAFIISILILLLVGTPLALIKTRKKKLLARDGMMIVALAWILLSAFGALPFYVGGYIPNYVDAFFESVSGFTTTGSTILNDVEILPHGIIFWRSLTHWFGGMGVLVFFIIIMSSMNGQTQHLMKAESTGPSVSKLVPRIKDTTKILYEIYFALTLLCTLFLLLAGMPLFDAVIHAFGTAGTGGFSNRNASIAHYNSYAIDMVISVFMILFGINFTMFFLIIKKKFKDVIKNEELRLYGFLVILATGLIMINTHSIYGSVSQTFRHAFFQVATIISSTGFGDVDFNLWPTFSKTVIVGLMLVGSCAGSTAGGFKQIRLLTIIKTIKRSIKRQLNPRSVVCVKIDGKNVDDEQIDKISIFCCAYFLIIFAAMFLLTVFDNFDIETNLTATISAISNIGPGLGAVGPKSNYYEYSNFSKIVLSMCMIIGRLEIYPILALFFPSSWKRA